MKSVRNRLKALAAAAIFQALLLWPAYVMASDQAATNTAGIADNSGKLVAEFEEKLTIPLLPPPLAEASEVPDHLKPVTSQPASNIASSGTSYFYIKNEPRDELEELISRHYGQDYEKCKNLRSFMHSETFMKYLTQKFKRLKMPNSHGSSGFTGKDRYLPNMVRAESEEQYLEQMRKQQTSEKCHKNLGAIADALNRYLNENPDARIRNFGDDDLKMLYRKGYLSKPIDIPAGCSYRNDWEFGEVFSGRDIYCPNHSGLKYR